MQSRNIRIIAYYLPQFHPITLNDQWWGKGYTEWRNVGSAKSLFTGHYQPRVPADLGYYDLRMPEIREMQAQMARDAGIEGFMYWHYYFGNGKRLLNLPFDEVLESKTPDFPFCLGWANHDWTNKQWTNDNKNDKTAHVVKQEYNGVEDYKQHFLILLKAFSDERYIKIEGKPLFFVYRPLDMPDPKEFITSWNELAIKNGLKGIYFVGLDTDDRSSEIFKAGFDAVNRNGQWRAECMVKGSVKRKVVNLLKTKFDKIVLDRYDYKEIIKHLYTEAEKQGNIYPVILPQWDRSPRIGSKAVIYYNSMPQLFKKNVEQALSLIKHKETEHQIVFLKSWNEWAEGNYVEPDMKFGHAYLNIIKECLSKES